VGGGRTPLLYVDAQQRRVVVRQAIARQDVKPWNTEAKRATVLEAVTRQPVKTQQTEKNEYLL
jgi:hypothetical protein